MNKWMNIMDEYIMDEWINEWIPNEGEWIYYGMNQWINEWMKE